MWIRGTGRGGEAQAGVYLIELFPVNNAHHGLNHVADAIHIRQFIPGKDNNNGDESGEIVLLFW